LPGYASIDTPGQLGAYVEVHNALSDFLADRTSHDDAGRPMLGDARRNLEELAAALAQLAAAWDGADVRAKETVYFALGAGRDGGPTIEKRMERLRACLQRDDMEGAEKIPPPDAFAAGARRMMAFRETAREIAEGIAAAKREKQARRAGKYDGLVWRLAELFAAFTGQRATGKRARWFIEAVTKTLPTEPTDYRPSANTIAKALRRSPPARR
jgi:hypothetical protein